MSMHWARQGPIPLFCIWHVAPVGQLAKRHCVGLQAVPWEEFEENDECAEELAPLEEVLLEEKPEEECAELLLELPLHESWYEKL